MFNIPPIPDWDGLHPLIIHFPIGALLLAPLLIIIGLLWRSKSKGFYLSAFILMLIGTIAAYVAVSTGEAAGELAERTPEIDRILETHQNLGESVRNIFTALTVIFGAILLLPVVFKRKIPQTVSLSINLAFVIAYAFGALALANTAHNGGKLVHIYGVKAMLRSTPPASTPVQATE